MPSVRADAPRPVHRVPLKAMPMAGGWDPRLIIGALILNGAWGLGVALFIRLLARIGV
jgi:hypothetical protein